MKNFIFYDFPNKINLQDNLLFRLNNKNEPIVQDGTEIFKSSSENLENIYIHCPVPIALLLCAKAIENKNTYNNIFIFSCRWIKQHKFSLILLTWLLKIEIFFRGSDSCSKIMSNLMLKSRSHPKHIEHINIASWVTTLEILVKNKTLAEQILHAEF